MDKLNFLIADDEALIRMDVKEMLTEAGHQVVGQAATGEEALDLARQLHRSWLSLRSQLYPRLQAPSAASSGCQFLQFPCPRPYDKLQQLSN